MKKLSRVLRELSRSLYNIYYYFRVVWEDRDWDFNYIERLSLLKLKKMYKYRTESVWMHHYIGEEKVNQALKLCINILERRQSGWYFEIDFNTPDSESIETRDWKTYCKIIEKYHQQLWD